MFEINLKLHFLSISADYLPNEAKSERFRLSFDSNQNGNLSNGQQHADIPDTESLNGNENRFRLSPSNGKSELYYMDSFNKQCHEQHNLFIYVVSIILIIFSTALYRIKIYFSHL